MCPFPEPYYNIFSLFCCLLECFDQCMMKYGKIFGGTDPEMIEGDIFRILIKVPEFNSMAQGERALQVTGQVKSLLRIVEINRPSADLPTRCWDNSF